MLYLIRHDPDEMPVFEDGTRLMRFRSNSAANRRSAIRSSMRHQDRQRHAFEDRARHPAEHQLADPRMAVSAHHEQIGTQISGARQEHVGDLDTAGNGRFDMRIDAVASQIKRDVGARNVAVLHAANDGIYR